MKKYWIIFMISIIGMMSSFLYASAKWDYCYYTDEFGDMMYDHTYVETYLKGVETVTYLDTYNNPGKYIFAATSETKGILYITSDQLGIWL